MPTPPNTPRSDIGLVSDSNDLGEHGRTPASDAVAAAAKKSRPDAGGDPAEPENQKKVTEDIALETNGAVAADGEPGRLTPEVPPRPVSEKKDPATASVPAAATEGSRNLGRPFPPLDYSQAHEAVEAQLRERMLSKYGVELVRDMDDAQSLLSYVTRNGLQEDRKVGAETIQTLISSREHMRDFTFNSEKEEAIFRRACGIIAKAAEPVTAASLSDSFKKKTYRRWLIGPKDELPIANIACRRYRGLAMLILVLLLGFQIYWTACSTVLTKTDALILEINKAPSREYYLAQEAARADALTAATQNTQPTKAPSTPPTSSSEGGSSAAASVVSLKPEKPSLTRDELVSKIAELNANYSMLDKFMRPFRRLYFVPTPPVAEPQPSAASQSSATPQPTPARQPAAAPRPTAAPNVSPSDEERTNGQDPDAIFQPSTFQTTSASIRAVASQVVDVMQKWLLPLLYGALGAVVFVVRTLSVQSRDRLFREEALVSLVLRVFLGMISGLAIGWFWNQTAPGASAAGALSASTLSPFALAFVAGYGVELFFALLDKIVSTFTNKTT